MSTRSRHVTVLSAAVGILLAIEPPVASAQPQRLAEAELFFELNDTDGDLGLHASIDGKPWTELIIRDDEDGHAELLVITARGPLGEQGVTQLSFESAEPPFDELRPEAFFSRFPEGRYEIQAKAVDGSRLTGMARLSHVLAAPPDRVRVNRAPAAESCDAPLPTVVAPVTVEWDAVTQSHDEIGKRGAVSVDRYEFIVEHDRVTMGVDLGADATQFEIPEVVTRFGGEFKFEIIVRTDAGNNTAVESCFVVRP